MRYLLGELPNGLRVVQVPMPGVQSCSVVAYIGLGSRYEGAGEAGVSHLIEHMLFKGTTLRPRSRDISEAVEGVGGMLNASTDKELTVYWTKTASEHVELCIDLLADMLRNSLLRRGDLAREKQVILEELAMLADDPQDWVHVLADETLWPGQPIGREIAGTPESVGALNRRDVIRTMGRYYGPNNALIAVAGGIRDDAIIPAVQRAFGDWEPVSVAHPTAAHIPEAGPRIRLERKPLEQTNICIVFPGMSRRHPGRWALHVLCTILGGGTSSRLFLRLREKLGLVYDVQMSTAHYSDTGSIVISAGMDGGNAERALDVIFEELRRVERRGIPAAELQKAKRFFRGRLLLGLEDTHSVASWFGGQLMLEDELVGPEEAADAVDGITSRDLLRVARELLRPESARVVAVGPTFEIGARERVAGA
ncbi:MAG TPA: pitrilysin family protein [Chloroflexota bacterium]|nr:pitrilysin family protein [Chloroflexota bacterium]